jgi:hypothetical protein
MGWLLAGVNAALAGVNAAFFAADGEPYSLGVAVFCGLGCIIAAINEASS